MTRKFNWLATTAGSMLAMLLLITGAQAATSGSLAANSNTTTLDLSQQNQLIALSRKKKKRLKPKAKKMATTKRATTTPVTTTPVTTAPTTTTTELTQTTPPPAPPEPTAPTQVAPPAATPPAEPAKAAEPAPNQFSLTTKLQGQVIFGATGTFAGDYNRNPAFGNRTRLELKTEIGSGTLTTRLQAVGLGSSTQNPSAGTPAVATNEGSLSWTDGTTDSKIGVDALKYEYPLTPQTQLVVAANAGASDDFTDTINPYFDGDGASGSISTFGNRPSIYYTVQGQGVGIRHKLSDSTELSVGYLARSGNDPATGSGLLGGGYGALAQVTLKTGENSKVGLTYTRTFNSDPGTGSLNANLGGISNNFGLQGSFQLSPEFALGGWAG
ncbi:iron uptake porin, partial [Chamaesiphon sp. VAR_48_metabat_403]|uniref:iron uptake porin n=1 Tax=Chamaesiphon sp. VAR_48_metabat_403 TaxID=2964700 RepID=UPI00286DEE85